MLQCGCLDIPITTLCPSQAVLAEFFATAIFVAVGSACVVFGVLPAVRVAVAWGVLLIEAAGGHWDVATLLRLLLLLLLLLLDRRHPPPQRRSRAALSVTPSW